MLEHLIKTFIVFFVVVEPISLVPMFGALTRGADPRFRQRMAVKGVVVSVIISYGFLAIGNWLLNTLGVSLDSFKIGGGVLMFLLAVDMVFARQSGLRSTTIREQDEARYREDISVFPLAFPLITGPGALATLLLLLGETRGHPEMLVALIVIIALVLAITLALLLAVQPVERVLGVTGANVVSRLAGVVLVALSVQYVVDGIKASFFG
jgi:multiple antibiotic resistance protein